MSDIMNRQDLDFLIWEFLEIDKFLDHEYFEDHDRETITSIIDVAQKIAEDELWTHATVSDANEPVFKDGKVEIIPEIKHALETLREAGFFSAHCDYDNGGLQLPTTIVQACHGLFKAGNIATAAYMSLTKAAANLLQTHGTDEQKRLYMGPMLEGRFFGTMCLSEPDVGSSLADLSTKAEKQADGSYHISGSKMWISGGEHELSENIIHLVLARLPDTPAGIRGVSLFVVPKIRVNADGSLGEHNNIALAGLNHKMGFRGTTNCLLNFGEQNPTVGYLVGEENHGVRCMFHMMNEARISVGMGASMLAYVGYRTSLRYASERKQGRHPGEKDPTSPQVPLIEHTDIKRMLLKQKAYAEGALALCLYGAQLIDRKKYESDPDKQADLELLLSILTPMIKTWPSEFGLDANHQAIQIHGGYGYTREFPVERLYRDNRLNPIHEGTTGIQGMDLLGRKVIMKDGRAYDLLMKEIRESIGQAQQSEYLKPFAQQLEEQLQSLHDATESARELIADGQLKEGLANATVYLLGFSHIVIAWTWLRQAMVAERSMANSNDSNRLFYKGKLSACQYFFKHELPTASAWFATVRDRKTDCLDFETEIFMSELE